MQLIVEDNEIIGYSNQLSRFFFFFAEVISFHLITVFNFLALNLTIFKCFNLVKASLHKSG